MTSTPEHQEATARADLLFCTHAFFPRVAIKRARSIHRFPQSMLPPRPKKWLLQIKTAFLDLGGVLSTPTVLSVGTPPPWLLPWKQRASLGAMARMLLGLLLLLLLRFLS